MPSKYYWNNKKYNEYTARGSLGLGFQNANQTITLLQFMEQTWYAGGSSKSETVKRFSQVQAVQLLNRNIGSLRNGNLIPHTNMQSSVIVPVSINGNYHFIGETWFICILLEKQYWFVGANFITASTRDKDDSYIRQ